MGWRGLRRWCIEGFNYHNRDAQDVESPKRKLVYFMPRNPLPNIRNKFTGTTLLYAILGQRIVVGREDIAKLIIEKGTSHHFKPGKEFIQQGAADNDIYLIICGRVEIRINGRPIAERHPGQHVGEMALLDPTTTRSASVIAKEYTVAIKLTEASFTEIAQQHSLLWRNLCQRSL